MLKYTIHAKTFGVRISLIFDYQKKSDIAKDVKLHRPSSFKAILSLPTVVIISSKTPQKKPKEL